MKKALYGLKLSRAAFQSLLADTLWEKGFRPTLGDPDVHIRPAKKPDRFEYYKLVLCYVDDVICVSHKEVDTLCEIMKGTFTIKQDRVEPLNIYLGAQLTKNPIEG